MGSDIEKLDIIYRHEWMPPFQSMKFVRFLYT